MQAAGRSLNMCRLLVDEYRADLNKVDRNGWTALDWAIRYEEQEIGEFLNSRGAITNRKTYPPSWLSKSQYLARE